MTDQQSELDQQSSRPQKQSAKTRSAATGSYQPGMNAKAIAAGLEVVFAKCRQAAWSLCGAGTRESAAWVTAYVLARLAEIPPDYLSYAQRQKIEESLDWLLEVRTPHGGWNFGGAGSSDDADSTAWAVTALRQHGRTVPEGALEVIQRCRRADGGFATHPESANENAVSRSSAADVTAIAVRALSAIDAASSEFLASNLRTDIEGRKCRLSSRFFVASTLMDWEPCMAPWLVVNAVRELVEQQEGEGAWELALLLRCRMLLRLQSAWGLAASLRRLQQPDGSWPGSARLATIPVLGNEPKPQFAGHLDEEGILATVTALSALAIGDLQPGLYFGSDLPFRRL